MRYFKKFFQELIIWRKFYKAAKQQEKFLNKHNLRVDNIGRIYTVVNIPEEVATNNQYVKEAWVLQQLKPFNDVLLKVGLADYAVPELRQIKEPGTNAFLVLLYPELNNLNIWKFLWHIIKLGAIIWLIKILYNLISKYIDLSVVWETVSSYL